MLSSTAAVFSASATSNNSGLLSASATDFLLSLPWKPLLQRLPGLLLLGLFPFAVFGPVYTPVLFSAHLFILHLLFLAANLRVAYAAYHAYYAARLHSTTDWYEKYLIETGQNDTTVQVIHDLPFDSILHVIIIPNYKEEMDTLCETLDVLASHETATTRYKICLAMEESEKGASKKAQTLLTMFSKSFYEITYTIHPMGRPGEIRGKSSNVAWAARQMSLRASPASRTNQILTIIDADTCFAQDYFDSITYHYSVATPEQRRIMMFAPSTVFDRNAKNVPVFVRVNDMLWSIGVISNLYEHSYVKFPCSAYSVSMNLAVSVDFWDAGPEAIGEDMHMYLKCFFSTRGNVIVKSIFSPASCCNVEGEGAGISGYFSALSARYTQGTRHLWGSLDTGYSLRRTLFSLLTPETESVVPIRGSRDEKLGKRTTYGFRIRPLLTLAHRLLEAHLIMGQFVLLTIVAWFLVPHDKVLYAPLANSFWSFMAAADVHPVLDTTLKACVYLRLLVTIPNIFTFYYYEKYHQWVGFDRWALQDTSSVMGGHCRADSAIDVSGFEDSLVEPMEKRVQYLGKRPVLAAQRDYPTHMLDWFAIPVAGFLFLVVPQFHAQLAHLFTDRLDYKVAAKPVLTRPVSQKAGHGKKK
ncbi:hypothetical protein HDU91_003703 [Kappamyces sp. JEL0680]|nr:hypothetical protein HDU91_003703 [Kappamyces sp. JEL0680]